MDNNRENDVPPNDGERAYADDRYDDPDKLPWLETGDDDDDHGGAVGRTIALVVGLLLLLALIVGGIYWYQQRNNGLDDGSGDVIEAAEGDYKVKPDDPEGREFEGEGDVAHATAEGRADTASMKGASTTESDAESDAKGSSAKTSSGTGLVQLGAFGDAEAANSMWSALTSRYDYLSSYKKSVKPATIEGRKIYRLNAVASDKQTAESLCAKLKKSGVSCLIPR